MSPSFFYGSSMLGDGWPAVFTTHDEIRLARAGLLYASAGMASLSFRRLRGVV